MGDNCSSSFTSLSRSSSASPLRLVAFLVRLAGGKTIVAGERAFCGVDAGGDGTVGGGASRMGGASGLEAAAAGTCLCQRRTSAGARASKGGAQAARYGNLVDASLVAKDYAHLKAGVDAMLIQSEKILPRNGWLGVGVRAISYNTDPGGGRIGDSTAAR
jgi:hypothetical protein